MFSNQGWGKKHARWENAKEARPSRLHPRGQLNPEPKTRPCRMVWLRDNLKLAKGGYLDAYFTPACLPKVLF